MGSAHAQMPGSGRPSAMFLESGKKSAVVPRPSKVEL